MEDGAIAFIEGRIVVEFHELRDLNGLKASQQVFSGAVHFFDAYVMHDADVHGFRKDVLQIALRDKEFGGNIFCTEGGVQIFSDERDGSCHDLWHFHWGKIGILRIVRENDEQFAQKRNEQRVERIGRINFGIGIEFLKKFKNGAVRFFAEAVRIRDAAGYHFAGEIDDIPIVICLRRCFQNMIFSRRDEKDRVFRKFIGNVLDEKCSAAFGYVQDLAIGMVMIEEITFRDVLRKVMRKMNFAETNLV